jgi:hypothetical protein
MLEKHPAKLEEMGDTDFQFMTKFEFRQLIQEYKQCIETDTAKAPTGSDFVYKTSSQSIIVKLPKSFRNFFCTQDGMGNVILGMSGLKSKYKNLWHDKPCNPSQVNPYENFL